MARQDPQGADSFRGAFHCRSYPAGPCQPLVRLRHTAPGHFPFAGRVAPGPGHVAAGDLAAHEPGGLYPVELGVGDALGQRRCGLRSVHGIVCRLFDPFPASLRFSEERLFRKILPEGDFHDPDYPVEELRCDCGKQLSHRVDRCTHNKFLVFLAKFWEGLLKIGRFALIGLVIEVVASTLIPTDWLAALLSGEGIAPILTLTFATIPLHLPQVTAAAMLYGFVSPEVGEGITLSKGAGIALLIGGPVTALPVMGIFISMFRKRVLLLYLFLCVSGTLFLAFAYRWLPIGG